MQVTNFQYPLMFQVHDNLCNQKFMCTSMCLFWFHSWITHTRKTGCYPWLTQNVKYMFYWCYILRLDIELKLLPCNSILKVIAIIVDWNVNKIWKSKNCKILFVLISHVYWRKLISRDDVNRPWTANSSLKYQLFIAVSCIE